MHKAKCKSCGEVIVSKRPGHFVECGCGKSFIDTDRWFPERCRFGGDAEYITDEEDNNTMGDIYPATGRTYEIEAAIRVISSDEFDVEQIGKTWTMTDFGVAVVAEYKRLINETL